MIRIGYLIILLFFETSLTHGQLSRELQIQIQGNELYKVGEPIFVKLIIENKTDSLKRIEFTETHEYHKQSPYATCITASVKDVKGKDQCSYASQYYVWSTLFTEKDLTYVDIRPGDKLIRDLKVNEIVSGCICYQDKGLKPGTYLISLAVHEQLTNQLKIEVR